MNISATFDTLACVEELRAAGFQEDQAKGLAKAFKKVQDSHLEELVTKDDLTHALQTLEYRMTIKLGGLMMAAVGVVAALVKLL